MTNKYFILSESFVARFISVIITTKTIINEVSSANKVVQKISGYFEF